MKISAYFLAALLATVGGAQVLPPSTGSVTSSSDAQYLVRFDFNIRIYAASKDEKEYRQISEFDSLWTHSTQKAFVSPDGELIVTFEVPEVKHLTPLEEVVCVYSREGKRLKKWLLKEILNKEDQAKLVSYTSGSIWWYHDMGISDNTNKLYVAGPVVADLDLASIRYLYELNLKALSWEKSKPHRKDMIRSDR